jgi:uncharacterized membrane protein
LTPSQALADALPWYATASLLAWNVYPLIFRATPGLPDRGVSLVRPLGLLFLVLVPWWFAAIDVIPFSNRIIVGSVVVMAIALWAYELRHREILTFLTRRWRSVVIFEVLTLALFLGYALFRGFNPAIADTEKPMDLAFLNSAMRSEMMPPADPWFAGQPINYYYLGYLLMAVLGRLSDTEPGVAFNLSLATLFAWSTVVATGTAANIARTWRGWTPVRVAAAGVLGGFFLTGVGNLATFVQFLQQPQATLSEGWFTGERVSGILLRPRRPSPARPGLSPSSCR